MKYKPAIDENSINAQEIINPHLKRQEILNELTLKRLRGQFNYPRVFFLSQVTSFLKISLKFLN